MLCLKVIDCDDGVTEIEWWSLCVVALLRFHRHYHQYIPARCTDYNPPISETIQDDRSKSPFYQLRSVCTVQGFQKSGTASMCAWDCDVGYCSRVSRYAYQTVQHDIIGMLDSRHLRAPVMSVDGSKYHDSYQVSPDRLTRCIHFITRCIHVYTSTH